MMMRAAIATLTLVLAVGCDEIEEIAERDTALDLDQDSDTDTDTDTDPEQDDDTDPVGDVFYADVDEILSDNCFGCHTDPPRNGAPIALTTFENVSARADLIVRRAVEGTPSPMPPGGLVLTPQEGEILRAWADAGAPR